MSHLSPTRQRRNPLLATLRGYQRDRDWPRYSLDLVGIPDGQRRAVVALLSSPTGCTYTEAAEALGIATGTLRRHLARLRARKPALYADVMRHRAAQLDARPEASQERRVTARAAYRAGCWAARGREPCARRKGRARR